MTNQSMIDWIGSEIQNSPNMPQPFVDRAGGDRHGQLIPDIHLQLLSQQLQRFARHSRTVPTQRTEIDVLSVKVPSLQRFFVRFEG